MEILARFKGVAYHKYRQTTLQNVINLWKWLHKMQCYIVCSPPKTRTSLYCFVLERIYIRLGSSSQSIVQNTDTEAHYYVNKIPPQRNQSSPHSYTVFYNISFIIILPTYARDHPGGFTPSDSSIEILYAFLSLPCIIHAPFAPLSLVLWL
jgi:hypothetical protein